jgi:CrcB protein
MRNLLLVAMGGAAGSAGRYLVQRWFTWQFLHPIPWATLLVNISGCLLIGIFWGLAFRTFNDNESWKLFLMTGICGGFTTFSAFTLEGIGLLREQRFTLFFGYVAASVLLGLLATWAGMRISR